MSCGRSTQLGAGYMGTSDGRDGWGQYFLAKGYAVYIMDHPRRGGRRHDGAQAETHPAPEARGDPPPRQGRGVERRHWPQLQRVRMDDWEALTRAAFHSRR
jgi:hypothetical protein